MDSATTLLFTARDGRTLDVLVGGYASSRTALVCHHGTPSDATIWNDWHADAVENKLRLISVSRPGYAFSERKPGLSVSCAAADVEDVLDALGIEKFLVIGGRAEVHMPSLVPHCFQSDALLPLYWQV